MSSTGYQTRKHQQYRTAFEYYEQGDLIAAKSRFQKLSRKFPSDVVIWSVLGAIHSQLGDHDKSIMAYKRALAITPKNPKLRTEFANSLYLGGQSNQAETELIKALELDPDHKEALLLAGTLYISLMKVDLAEEFFDRVIKIDPSDILANSNLVTVAIEQHNFEKAEQLIQRFEMIQEQEKSTEIDLEIKFLRAKLFTETGNYHEASLLFQDLLDENPDDEWVLISLMNFHTNTKNHSKVVEIGERLINQFGEQQHFLYDIALSWFMLGDYEKAQIRLEQAFKTHPKTANQVRLNSFSGDLSLTLGNRQRAEQHYQYALKLDPQYGPIRSKLAMMKTFHSADDPDVKMIKESLKDENLKYYERSCFEFALAKIYDDLQEWDRAFEIWDVANRHILDTLTNNVKGYLIEMGRIIVELDSPPAKVAQTRDDVRPIFIVGMPKCGSSLIEQILVRNSKVKSLRAFRYIQDTVIYLEQYGDPHRVYPDDYSFLNQYEIERGVDKYLDMIHNVHAIDQPWIIDSNSLNFAYLWIIRAMFPDAPIVHCHRHPLDMIVSSYFELYKSQHVVFYNLEYLAKFYVQYQKLMNHWHKLFPNIIDIHYDDLVEDMVNQIRRLCSDIGLENEEHCLNFHSSDTIVEHLGVCPKLGLMPLVKKGHWHNYAKHLGGVIEILNEAGIIDSSGNTITE